MGLLTSPATHGCMLTVPEGGLALGRAISSAEVMPTRANSEDHSLPAISAAGEARKSRRGSGWLLQCPQRVQWIRSRFSKANCSGQRPLFSSGYPFIFPVEEFTFEEVGSHAIQHKPKVFFF